MPVNNNNDQLGTEWLQHATYFWGIPLHPLGEVDTVAFMNELPDNLALTRDRVIGLQFQTASVLLATFIFIRNLRITIRMVMSRMRTLSAWFCFVPALLGTLFGLTVVYALLFSGLNCRKLLWLSGIVNTIAMMCNSGVLLQKAYLVLCRQRWIAIFGTLFTLPQLGFLVIVMVCCPITVEPLLGCVLYYPSYLPLYWFFASVPISLFFSAIFSYVAYRQYSMFGSDAWKRLARDGIQTMCLAVLCNIVCGIIIVFQIGGNYAIMFYVADWLLTSTILLNHCQNMRKASRLSNRPKTQNIINLSQIPTSKSIFTDSKLNSPVSKFSSIAPLTSHEYDD
ncbi:hypothetical protein SYNPS1DRAFT_21661 [Syncephalis pseudoplumigaleata]|uniref:7TM GPCR serpentine receptor class x (Srx) domain-containing protein n=1 Tax=Syncephalis pseudoplumigaleata TaxID=1712513 RepID=A0A4P9Z4V2_9FUNG|nr:hypothetical protein SYNPS1DRAFT_21661 [Syncephalis pseudoplumigaleata]|eukprot:RKP26610.1 hypothetical protein SYNPS1DRAFT_21661 [Syncephalis pseudoplumigaleata]